MNEDLRKQVKSLKCFQGVTYREIAQYLEISESGMYSWLRGNYNLGYEKQKRLQEIIDNLEE